MLAGSRPAFIAVALALTLLPLSAQAQSKPAGAALAGTYEGQVKRAYLDGRARETRIYRVTFNPDLSTGKVFVYEADRKLRNELGFVVKRTAALTYKGKTVPINAVPGYQPDRMTMVFSADGKALAWSHTDDTTRGSGTLARQAQ
jgi:hypothetical protein